MPRNSLIDLNNHLFAQLERLSDEDLKGEDIDLELKRAKAMTGVSSQIIKSSKVMLDAAKMIANGVISAGDLPENLTQKKIS